MSHNVRTAKGKLGIQPLNRIDDNTLQTRLRRYPGKNSGISRTVKVARCKLMSIQYIHYVWPVHMRNYMILHVEAKRFIALHTLLTWHFITKTLLCSQFVLCSFIYINFALCYYTMNYVNWA